MTMTDDELYALFVTVGFPRDYAGKDGPEDLAAYMVAIALRESGGDPSRFNGNAETGDCSLGLCQINLRDDLVVLGLARKYPAALRMTGTVTPIPALLDPQVNATAARLLYNGVRSWMDTLWYIDRPGVARDRFLALLPRAQAAAVRYRGTAPAPAH